MTTRIETQNSTYEVDYEGRKIRQVDGDSDDNSRWPEDRHVWRGYSDIQNVFHRIYVVWPDGKATLTTEIQGAEEVA